MTIRITQEVLKEINERFDYLIKVQPWKEQELRVEKSILINALQKADRTALKKIKENCSPYIPEDAQTLLNHMKNKELATEGLTEENITTILIYILTQDISCISEEKEEIHQIPDTSIQSIVDYIQVDNIRHMQTLNHQTFLAREADIDSILNDIPSLPNYHSLGVSSSIFL